MGRGRLAAKPVSGSTLLFEKQFVYPCDFRSILGLSDNQSMLVSS